jgi:hypothetical protein
MAFDVWVMCLIGTAFAMFLASLLQDLAAYLWRAHVAKPVLAAQAPPCPQAPAKPIPIYWRSRSGAVGRPLLGGSREDESNREAMA